jgi:hypothetical protein
MARKKPAAKKSRKKLAVKKVPVKDLPPSDKDAGVKGGFEILSPLKPLSPDISPTSRYAPPYVPVGPGKYNY